MGNLELIKSLLDHYNIKSEVDILPDGTEVLVFERKKGLTNWNICVKALEGNSYYIYTVLMKVSKSARRDICKVLNGFNKKFTFAKLFYQESEQGTFLYASCFVPPLDLGLVYLFDKLLEKFVSILDDILIEIPILAFQGKVKNVFFCDGVPVIKIDASGSDISVGHTIAAKTHAEFLNILLHKSYDGYGKCVFSLNDKDVIWMIRLDNKPTATGWCNSLSSDGEKITESYIGAPVDRLESHKSPPFQQRRYVFDIIENPTKIREYVFRGVFEFARDEGNNDCRVWNRVAEIANFEDIQNSSI